MDEFDYDVMEDLTQLAVAWYGQSAEKNLPKYLSRYVEDDVYEDVMRLGHVDFAKKYPYLEFWMKVSWEANFSRPWESVKFPGQDSVDENSGTEIPVAEKPVPNWISTGDGLPKDSDVYAEGLRRRVGGEVEATEAPESDAINAVAELLTGLTEIAQEQADVAERHQQTLEHLVSAQRIMIQSLRIMNERVEKVCGVVNSLDQSLDESEIVMVDGKHKA